MKNILLLCLLSLALSPLAATNYYIDATSGDDSNDGLTPATAWQTLLSIQAVTFNPAPGDSILLKRGEAWRGDPLEVFFVSTAEAPLVVSNYGVATDSVPLITSVDVLPGSDVAANWTEISTNVWSLDLNLNPNRVLLDGAEVLRANELVDLGTTDGQGVFSKWFWRSDSTLFLHESANPAFRYRDGITGNISSTSMLAIGAVNMVFDGLEFEGGSVYSAAILASDSLVIKNCKIGRYASTGMGITGINTAQGYFTSSYIEVLDNTFDSGFEIFHGLGSTRGCSNGLIILSSGENCTVSGNTFRNWANNGIEMLGNFTNVGGANNNLVEDNYISAPNISFSRGISINGAEDRSALNRFYRNTIDSTRAASFVNGNNNVFEHNIIRTVRQSTAIDGPSAYGIIVAVLGNGFVSHDNDFDHNLVLNTDEAAFYILGIGAADQAMDNRIRNNIFFNNALQPFGGFYPAGQALLIDKDDLGPNTYQNNILFDEAGSPAQVFLPATGESLTVTAFNALNGTDGDVITNNLKEDPDFIDLAAGNYTPEMFGGAVDAGLDLGYDKDFVLADRNQGAAPDIGPLESGLIVPSELTEFTAQALTKTSVELNWNTISETATDRFYVERKSDHRFWAEVGSVSAAGFSRASLDYSFTDQEAPIGTLYYRLRMVDLDGSYSYSPIREITLSADGLDLRWLDLRTAELQLPDGKEMSDVTASFYSIDGRGLPLTVSGNQLQFSADLPAGIYLLVVDGKGMKVSLR
ncbi:right-handed parallel beta-helix repeat-containing protein [Neolewinella persica]|uniref:right-handed parallel beta-helix repeat-containing protein n=1 Tax=Neolewinella persica TaxID=70998 RepID=UPI0003A30315|nr:right-handed parallel beta-helix repeat-containing protein [Neolewinella persica]